MTIAFPQEGHQAITSINALHLDSLHYAVYAKVAPGLLIVQLTNRKY